jgi:uncharacterized membrane protein YgcG
VRTAAANHKAELWKRLRAYRFENLVPPQLIDQITSVFGGGDASTRAFAGKLGRKLGWNSAFAMRAIEEYKRFLYLGMVSDFYVTPPKIIDHVWHEHLLFTRAYRDFCREVLGRDFDHAPELVSLEQQTREFEAQYAATLALYFDEFHAPPPFEIWGAPKFATPAATPRAKPRKKERRTQAEDGSVYYDGPPLHTVASDGDLHSPHGSSGGSGFDGFGEGGGFSGGGSSGDFGGGDSSGSDGGGSGCSSGCGGGGGGD